MVDKQKSLNAVDDAIVEYVKENSEGKLLVTNWVFEESLLLSDSNVQYMRIDGEESDDFLIDSDTLIDEGRMPRRVARWLEGLDAKA